MLLAFNHRGFAAKTSLSPDCARVQADQIGETYGPRAGEERSSFGSPLTPCFADRGISIVAIAVAKIVRDREPKDGQDQLASAVGPPLQGHVGGNKQSYSAGLSPDASALANFQAVRGLMDLPRRVDRRVG